MSELSPLSGANRKLDFGAVRSAFDPGCVKTCTSQECAELFSLFSSFDGDCQSGSFLIQCNRDKLSTRKCDVGVFTQPGPLTDLSSSPCDPAVDFTAKRNKIDRLGQERLRTAFQGFSLVTSSP